MAKETLRSVALTFGHSDPGIKPFLGFLKKRTIAKDDSLRAIYKKLHIFKAYSFSFSSPTGGSRESKF